MDKQSQEVLLTLARDSLASAVAGGDRSFVTSDLPDLQASVGAFVTLTIEGQLRGCIGRLTSDKPLYVTIQDMAVSAGLEDPRFAPVRESELEALSFEISVLSPFQEVDSISTIQVGVNGLLLQHARGSGVLLPQVPGEHGWDRDQFLVQISRKAGLEDMAWREGRLFSFTAEVF